MATENFIQGANDLAATAAKLAEQAARLAGEAAQIAVSKAPAMPVEAAVGGHSFLFLFTTFVLACFIGYYVVWSVTPALH